MSNRIAEKSEMVALVQRILDLRYSKDRLPGLLDLLTRSTGRLAIVLPRMILPGIRIGAGEDFRHFQHRPAAMRSHFELARLQPCRLNLNPLSKEQ